MEVALSMKLRRPQCWSLLAVLSLGWAIPAGATDIDPYLPNDTEIVAQLNIRQLLDSPLIKQLVLEHLKNALKSSGEAETIFQELGLDPFTDLSTVTLAGPGGDDPTRGVAIVHGKFNLGKFHAL